MLDWLFLIPALPLISSLLLLLSWGRLKPFQVVILGVGSMGLAAALTLLVGLEFVANGSTPVRQLVFSWLPLANHSLNFALYLDQLSLTMTAISRV